MDATADEDSTTDPGRDDSFAPDDGGDSSAVTTTRTSKEGRRRKEEGRIQPSGGLTSYPFLSELWRSAVTRQRGLFVLPKPIFFTAISLRLTRRPPSPFLAASCPRADESASHAAAIAGCRASLRREYQNEGLSRARSCTARRFRPQKLSASLTVFACSRAV